MVCTELTHSIPGSLISVVKSEHICNKEIVNGSVCYAVLINKHGVLGEKQTCWWRFCSYQTGVLSTAVCEDRMEARLGFKSFTTQQKTDYKSRNML